MIVLKVLLLVVLTLCCFMLIGLILLQKAKSEGLGLAFGAGTGESLFGARAGNVLSKATVILGAVFMVCSLLLGVLFAQRDKTLMEEVTDESAPSVSVQPALETLDLGTSVVTPDFELLPESQDSGVSPEEPVPEAQPAG